MKTFFTTADTPLRISVLLFLLLFTNSCIYDEPDDQFYRTLWVCEEWKEVMESEDRIGKNGLDVTADSFEGTKNGEGSSDGLRGMENDFGGTKDGLERTADYSEGTEGYFGRSTDGTDGGKDDALGASENINGADNGHVGEMAEEPSRLTIDFLCDNKVCVTATGASGSYGTYEHNDNTAYFHNTRLSYPCDGNPIVIVIEEAHRTHDLLLISWHYSGSDISYSTRLVRKSSY